MIIVARKQIKLRTVAYVHVGDQLVNVNDLTPEQKHRLSVELTVTMLNAAYQGQAHFWCDESEEGEKKCVGT